MGEAQIHCAQGKDWQRALGDVQVRARNMVVTVAHPEGGEVQMPGNPVKMSDTDEDTFAPPPLLGQQTDEVLSSLGCDAKRIAARREAGAVG